MRQVTRQKIEMAALSLFARKGLSVKVSEIATACEISQGLMYSHYPSKDALIIELVQQALTSSSKYVMEHAGSDETAVTKIKNITKMMCLMFSDAPFGIDYFMFMVQVGMSNFLQQNSLAFSDEIPNPVSILAGIIVQGQSEGTAAAGDPFQLSTIYWATIQGLCGYAITGMSVSPDPMILNRILLNEENYL